MFQLRVFVTVWLWICFALQAGASSSFRRTSIEIGKHKMMVELAENPEQHAQGLMYRKSLPQDQGMLFVFNEEAPRSFWMKNTFIPLSIAYIDARGKIIDIQDMSPVKSVLEKEPPSYQSKGPARYALEVNQGFFKKNRIKVGDQLKLPIE